MSATVTTLLAELTARGVEVRANGNRLRCRPRSALTTELLERIRRNKPAILAALAAPRPVGASPPTFCISADPMQFGDVCPGWTPRAWAQELRRKADRCAEHHADTAAHYLKWADSIERRLPREDEQAEFVRRWRSMPAGQESDRL